MEVTEPIPAPPIETGPLRTYRAVPSFWMTLLHVVGGCAFVVSLVMLGWAIFGGAL